MSNAAAEPSEAITAELQRKIYVAAGGELGRTLVERLAGAGFEVRASEDPAAVVEAVRAWRPDVVLLAEVLPGRSGRQVLLSLRANGELFKVPIVGVLADVSVSNVLSWLRVGATDLWKVPFTRDLPERTRELLFECARSQVQLGQMKARLLAWVGRAQLSGTVTTYPGTPFEGRATFVKGELQSAQFSSFTGEKALEHLLELEGGAVRWDEEAQQPAPAAGPSGYRPRVLVVEDDPAIRTLISRQLGGSNYQVEAAADGQVGLQHARQHPLDIVVADLDLPRLDGWGLLRALRTDVALREVAVLVLSAHEGAVDTLKAARSGARAYLKKSGRSKELLDTLALLAAPRAAVWDALAARKQTAVEVRAVGALWLLRALAELDCAGTLELEDELGRYELSVAQGQLLEVAAQTGSLRTQGVVALNALISSRGVGQFSFKKMEIGPKARWIYEVLDETCAALRHSEGQRLSDAVAQPGKLYLNEELAALFSRVASLDQLKVLEAVRDSPDSLDALAATTGLPLAEVEPALAELLRRGVLSTEA